MTVEQFGLFTADRSIEECFLSFHVDHPEVYDELVTLARSLTARGYTHLGIGMMWETLRYFRALRGLPDDNELFKLNNNYRSRCARLIIEREPDLAGLFETRELRAV